jgi:hypothetical protein
MPNTSPYRKRLLTNATSTLALARYNAVADLKSEGRLHKGLHPETRATRIAEYIRKHHAHIIPVRFGGTWGSKQGMTEGDR